MPNIIQSMASFNADGSVTVKTRLFHNSTVMASLGSLTSSTSTVTVDPSNAFTDVSTVLVPTSPITRATADIPKHTSNLQFEGQRGVI